MLKNGLRRYEYSPEKQGELKKNSAEEEKTEEILEEEAAVTVEIPENEAGDYDFGTYIIDFKPLIKGLAKLGVVAVAIIVGAVHGIKKLKDWLTKE